MYSYVCFLLKIVCLVSLHLNPHATMRMELEGFTLLLWPELLPVSLTSKEKCKAQNFSESFFRSLYIVNDCKRYAGYDKLTE